MTTVTLTKGQMPALGRSKQTGDNEGRIVHYLITVLSSMSLQAHGGGTSYFCNAVVDSKMSLLCHRCQDVDHNKHPEEEDAERGQEARPFASCYASPVRRGLATQPARPGTDELDQLLRVAKHIISFVTVIRPGEGPSGGGRTRAYD